MRVAAQPTATGASGTVVVADDAPLDPVQPMENLANVLAVRVIREIAKVPDDIVRADQFATRASSISFAEPKGLRQ